MRSSRAPGASTSRRAVDWASSSASRKRPTRMYWSARMPTVAISTSSPRQRKRSDSSSPAASLAVMRPEAMPASRRFSSARTAMGSDACFDEALEFGIGGAGAIDHGPEAGEHELAALRRFADRRWRPRASALAAGAVIVVGVECGFRPARPRRPRPSAADRRRSGRPTSRKSSAARSHSARLAATMARHSEADGSPRSEPLERASSAGSRRRAM